MLKLSDVEIETRNNLLNSWGYNALADIEEDCCGATSYHYIVKPSGIGDTIYLVYKDNVECISDLDSF